MLATWATGTAGAYPCEGRLVFVGEEPQLKLPGHDAFQFFTDQAVEDSNDWQRISPHWQRAIRAMVDHIRSFTSGMVAIDIRTGIGPNKYDIIFDMMGVMATPLDAFMRDVVAIFSKAMDTDIQTVPAEAR